MILTADTGLDWNNCLFYDSDQPVPSQIPQEPREDEWAAGIVNLGPPTGRWTQAGHRKVRAYWPYMDSQDAQDGHGTHSAGVLLGQSSEGDTTELRKFSGMAKGAKMLLMDAGCSSRYG